MRIGETNRYVLLKPEFWRDLVFTFRRAAKRDASELMRKSVLFSVLANFLSVAHTCLVKV